MLLRRLPGPRKRVGERERFVYWASLLRKAGKQNKMLLRRLPGPRKRVGERERFVYWASLLRKAGKQNKMLLRRLPGPRKRVGERVHTYAHARTKTISRPKYIQCFQLKEWIFLNYCIDPHYSHLTYTYLFFIIPTMFTIVKLPV